MVRSVTLRPALANSRSMRPWRATIPSATAWQASPSTTSSGATSALPPAASMRAAAAASGASRRPDRTTVIPAAASVSAVASPMPEPAPVTQAIFP